MLPLSGYGGEVIHLRHEEPDSRLAIVDEMQHLRLAEKGKQQTCCITPVGLKRIRSIPIWPSGRRVSSPRFFLCIIPLLPLFVLPLRAAGAGRSPSSS